MTELATARLLQFARKLQHASSFTELLVAAREEASATLGYEHVWLMVADDEDAEELKLIDIAGDQREVVWQVAPTLKVKGDRFLETLMSSDEPVIIPDARSDPRTNKEIVERLQNRTLINIPLRLVDKPFGIFGLGTFGDEGCRDVNDSEVSYLVGMASQLSVAASRIRFLEERANALNERQELERRILQIQKLESLGMLAGGIAHDFNNLLTVITASASLAGENSPDAQSQQELRAILAATKRASDLTRQLLAMSREQELTLRPLDMNGQLGQLVELARRVIPENISIDLIPGRALPLVEGDASQIDQVFMNLFLNARDAMPSGGRLTIETEQVVVNSHYTQTHPWAKPGRYVLATVTDTGMGMPREVADRVFEPFFTTKAQRAGTGLGLAVAYGIVRQHGGMLHCYSEVGVGTSFKVYLPALTRLASAVGTKLQSPPERGSERILVAEDDEQVRGVITRILERAGYAVTVVEDGDAAWRAVNNEAFDLLILDMVMPGMQSREVIERVQALRPSLRVLLTSGYSSGSNISALAQRTGLELLRKPFDPDQVLLAVRQALDVRVERE